MGRQRTPHGCRAPQQRHRHADERGLEPLTQQLVTLFVLALPVAAIAWTVTHEEVFRELRDWCAARSRASRAILPRKFFYLFTCEYCFSHYVAAGVLLVTGFTLVYPGWRGAFVAFFALVWIANIYISLFGRLRLEIREERAEAEKKEAVVETFRSAKLSK